MKGVEYLIANKLLERSPASVAKFLRTTLSLNKVEQWKYAWLFLVFIGGI